MNRLETITVKLFDLEVQVTGNYCPHRSGSFTEPSDPASFEVDKVIFNGYDITDSLNQLDEFYYDQMKDPKKASRHIPYQSIWENLEDLCLEKVEE